MLRTAIMPNPDGTIQPIRPPHVRAGTIDPHALVAVAPQREEAHFPDRENLLTDMPSLAQTNDPFARLPSAERRLLDRHGIRLWVDKVTQDGRYALCTACQVKRPFFRRDLDSHELVHLAHGVLNVLYRIGISPMISLVAKQSGMMFPDLEEQDPFHLHHALRTAGHESRLLSSSSMPPDPDPHQ